MTAYINITLKPKYNNDLDLGDTPCLWDAPTKNLDFLDAPYGFYEYIDEALGYDESTYTARSKFLLEFFTKLNNLIDKNGFYDGLHSYINMSEKFFGVCFEVNFYLGE